MSINSTATNCELLLFNKGRVISNLAKINIFSGRVVFLRFPATFPDVNLGELPFDAQTAVTNSTIQLGNSQIFLFFSLLIARSVGKLIKTEN